MLGLLLIFLIGPDGSGNTGQLLEGIMGLPFLLEILLLEKVGIEISLNEPLIVDKPAVKGNRGLNPLDD